MTPEQKAAWEAYLGEILKYGKKLHEFLHPTSGTVTAADEGSLPPPPPPPPPHQ